MEYQQARQAEASVRMPEQAADRQLKSITDNRPEATAQRRLMEGMARGTGVAQRMRKVHRPLLEQTGGNCGLFCIRMAIEALGGAITNDQYDDAAEAAGSNIGEIFSFDVMKEIVESLGYKANRMPFRTAVELKTMLTATGNPMLIAFSNLAYRTTMKGGGNPGGDLCHTQRGHWSIVERLTGGELKIANPWQLKEKISLGNMFQANKAMDGNTVPRDLTSTIIGTQRGVPPQYDWSSYVPGIYRSMGDRAYVLEEDTTTTPVTMKRTIVKDRTSVANWATIDAAITANLSTAAYVPNYLADARAANKIYSAANYGLLGLLPGWQTNAAVDTGINRQQNLDLAGYIVEITT